MTIQNNSDGGNVRALCTSIVNRHTYSWTAYMFNITKFTNNNRTLKVAATQFQTSFGEMGVKRKRRTSPSHWKNASDMFNITKFTDNSFFSLYTLHFIHRSWPSTHNISYLCNKPFINLHWSNKKLTTTHITKLDFLLFINQNSSISTRKKWLVL